MARADSNLGQPASEETSPSQELQHGLRRDQSKPGAAARVLFVHPFRVFLEFGMQAGRKEESRGPWPCRLKANDQ